jgi:type I restriction enzyme S subunit
MAVEELVGRVPDGWTYTTLGRACADGGGDVQTGPFGSQLHAADYVPVGVPSIMPQNIGDNRISEYGIARITSDDATRLSKYLVREGDIVYSRRGDVEKRALIRANETGWLCGTGCLRVRLGDKGANPSYAAYYLGHPSVREWIVRHAHGATMPNLNTSILSSCPFVLPPPAEQYAIAHILGTLDDKIELNRRRNQTLEAMARALFKDWFVDFGPVRAKMEGRKPYLPTDLWQLFPDCLDDEGKPEGWEFRRVSEFLTLAYGKSMPAKKRIAGNFPVYGSGGITGSHNEALISGPAVIVGRKGTVGSLYWEDRASFPIDTVFYVQPEVPLVFCYHLLDSLPLHNMNTDAAVPGLNRDNVYRLEVAGPPDELISFFADTTSRLRESMTAISVDSEILVQLRDTLLPKLISGELRIAEAEIFVSRST